MSESTCTVNVLRCKHCGTLAVAVNGYRITSHKCAGAWDIVRSETVDPNDVRRGLEASESVE